MLLTTYFDIGVGGLSFASHTHVTWDGDDPVETITPKSESQGG